MAVHIRDGHFFSQLLGGQRCLRMDHGQHQGGPAQGKPKGAKLRHDL